MKVVHSAIFEIAMWVSDCLGFVGFTNCLRSVFTVKDTMTTIELDQGWESIENVITKLKSVLEWSPGLDGSPKPEFTDEECMMIYSYPSLDYLLLPTSSSATT